MFFIAAPLGDSNDLVKSIDSFEMQIKFIRDCSVENIFHCGLLLLEFVLVVVNSRKVIDGTPINFMQI